MSEQHTPEEAVAEAERMQDIVGGNAELDNYSTADEKTKQEDAVTEMAGQLHEEWRASRLQEDGTYEPRIKRTSDQEWITKTGAEMKSDDGGKVYAELDIANTPYEKLPKEWQAENKISAEVSVGLVVDAIKAEKSLDETFIEEASAVVHEKWLERNGEWAPDEQKLPYEQLSEEEKEKDRVFIRQAISIVSKG